MKMLVIVDRTWPCDHSFIEDFIAKRLSKEFELRFLFYCKQVPNDSSNVFNWYNSICYIFESRFAYYRSLLSTVWKGKFDYIFVRNRPIVALLVKLILSRKSVLIFQLSHLKEEGWRYRLGSSKLAWILASSIVTIRSCIRGYAIRACDLFMPVSQSMVSMLNVDEQVQSKILVMPLGIDSEKVSDLEYIRTENPDLGCYRLIYAGTLNRSRRLHLMVQSVKNLQDLGVDIELDIFGSSPNRVDLASIQCAAGSTCSSDDRIRIHDPIPRERLYRKMVNEFDAGLCYLPSIDYFRQNSPIKLMDYLACGLKVVATPQDEHIAILRSVPGGIISESDSPEDFSRAIVKSMHLGDNPQEISNAIISQRSYDLLLQVFREKLSEYTNG